MSNVFSAVCFITNLQQITSPTQCLIRKTHYRPSQYFFTLLANVVRNSELIRWIAV